MGTQPTVFILNQTCLEIVDHLRGWIETLPITLHADHTLGTMTAEESDRAIEFADALVLPVEEQMIILAFFSSAFATATTIPLSLKEPVGLQDSNLK